MRVLTTILCLCMATHAAHSETFQISDAPLDPNNFNAAVLLDDDLYYGVRAQDAQAARLIRIDAETGAWNIAAEIADDRDPLYIRELTVMNDTIYFIAAPLVDFFGSVWKYTPATGATDLLKAYEGTAPRGLQASASELYIATWSPTRAASGLWRSNGTPAGTRLAGTGFVPESMTTLEPYVYFTSLGSDLYRIDPTIGPLNIASGLSFRDRNNRRILKVVLNNFRTYFLAGAASGQPLELWSTDGSERGTRQESFLKGSLKNLPPETGGAAGADPPYLGVINGDIIFSYQENPFWYFYRLDPNAPDGTNARPLSEEPFTFFLPFNHGLILAGAIRADRRDFVFWDGNSLSNLNVNDAFGPAPGPLLSTPQAAYVVDISDTLGAGDPTTYDFPFYRLDAGAIQPTRLETGPEFAGQIFGAAAAVGQNVAYIYLLDPTGTNPLRLARMAYPPPTPEGEPEGIAEGEGQPEGEGEGEDLGNLPALAQQILDAYPDANDDGQLTPEELQAAAITLSQAQFNALDTDNSNSLTQAELINAGAIPPPTGCACPQATNTLNQLFGDLLTISLAALLLLATTALRRYPG